MKVTVVMPTFNQCDALLITLKSFAYQKQVEGVWELILIDDGSEDRTKETVEAYAAPYPLTYLRIEHAGRAAARNVGLRAAQSDLILFCDSDRAVSNHFVLSHLRAHAERLDLVVIGDIWEFYFTDLHARQKDLIADIPNDLQRFQRLARRPVYAKAVYQMFDKDGFTRYAMPWIAFFSGNVSVRVVHLKEVGGFDEKFIDWGLEHFDLGYRLYDKGLEFVLESRARNYHFAHARSQGFYQKNLETSLTYFESKYPSTEVRFLADFLGGRISLQRFHNNLAQAQRLAPISEKEPAYYRQFSRSERSTE